MAGSTDGRSVRCMPSDCWSGKGCLSGKDRRSEKKMSVGKDFIIATNSRSVKNCWSGKAFADRTFGDNVGRENPFPTDLPSLKAVFPTNLAVRNPVQWCSAS